MKWQASNRFYSLLAWATDNEQEGANLGGNKVPDNPTMLPVDLDFRPVEVGVAVEYLPTAEEIASYISFVDLAA